MPLKEGLGEDDWAVSLLRGRIEFRGAIGWLADSGFWRQI